MSSPIPPLPAGAKIKLTVVRGNRVGRAYGLREGISFIGRQGAQPVDVNMDDHEKPGNVFAQNRHACIMYQKGLVTITDPGTKTGTFVNRVKIQAGKPHQLKAEDVVQIGNVALQLKVVGMKKKTGQQK